mgnify:CR=1 FL=1
MPMERERYPDNWEEIALNVKREADWKCQRCGRQCRLQGITIAEWLELARDCPDYEEKKSHPHRWTMSVAHLNHDPENPNAELEAMCSACHLRYDAKMHAQTAKRNRRQRLENAGQMVLTLW